ncbi:MAG: thiamine phosphate synthase [Muribaculaceae bacterium]|nr:thiamine phosphate synthase [Muribaculaceae bacterium]
MLQFITHSTPRMNEIQGVAAALAGGCGWIQLRMKNVSDQEFIAAGRVIGGMCRNAGATFILDDRVHLVNFLDADGVHVGKNDMPVAQVRNLLGEDKIIGATANSVEDAMKAIEAGADYLGAGPFRFTTTKEKLSPILGAEGLANLMRAVRSVSMLPVVAIGGIGIADIEEIIKSGVSGIAVSGTILNAPSPEYETEKILKELKKWTI